MTAGGLLLEAAGQAGWYGLMTRSSGPQIRGGEAAALVRLSTRPVESHKDRFDLLLAIDWNNADRFAGEIALDHDSLIIGDRDSRDPLPARYAAMGGRQAAVALAALARQIEGGRANMVALGILAGLIGLPLEALEEVAGRILERKGTAAVTAGRRCIAAGAEQAPTLPPLPALAGADTRKGERWSITGNEAAGLGAIRGGVRFAAAYPITPATELLEWLAPALRRVGGVLIQAEDELASINQLIGASFGGVPALTATSGPGLALMTESIGLAVASETPLVVVDVMRGGPSTGIPTKSEQSDLNIALYGLHGDAPHLVLAPTSIGDCLFTTQWAVHLAESLQTAAIVLSDQSLGQSRVVMEPPADLQFVGGRRLQEQPVADYRRYAVNDSGVSPMALPGTPGCQYTADGLEHAESGTPSSRADDHHRQLAKRRRKLERFDYGDHWAVIEGEGETGVVTWGSSCAPVREALALLQSEGIGVRLIALRLLLPARPEQMEQALRGLQRLLVVEQTEGAQFHHYLKSCYTLPADTRSMAIPGPLPIRPLEVYLRLR
ncbi:MAG TPA: 2-oxoacid:acceptor oxidoreductase subunit alpha, partial [Sedimenticola thiotaurini]|nr:2-oxoacid:acceptor oxidoreductase subunit alpha [Sedimenticola thiotaurini]